jgi:NAD(P) transhydrogenase
MSVTHAFDLVVIGAGPAGESAAVTAALLGKAVGVVERATALGGAAINTGTVPSKTLRETALALSGLRTRDLYGVDLSLRRSATIEEFLRHERKVKTTEREQSNRLFEQYGVKVFHGTGSFVDPHTVRVAPDEGPEVQLRGDKIVIAVGSAPVRPPGLPFEHNRLHDSDELVDLYRLPQTLAVVGAGVIGCEYACTFAALGVPTTLIDGRDILLPFLDPEVSAALRTAMERLGVRFIWNEKVSTCLCPADESAIRLGLSGGRALEFDQVLVCAGRASRTTELNPAAAGVEVADKGRLVVDAHYRTKVPHIYAVGDVIGFPALASTSAEQGRVAACHAFESTAATELASVLPTGIYTIPEVSSAGATESQLREKKTDYVVGRANYADVPRGQIIGDRAGFLKLLFRRDDLKLLGVHVIGEQASEVVHIGLLALMSGAGADLFLRTCFNYPTLGELYKVATHDAYLRRAVGTQSA